MQGKILVWAFLLAGCASNMDAPMSRLLGESTALTVLSESCSSTVSKRPNTTENGSGTVQCRLRWEAEGDQRTSTATMSYVIVWRQPLAARAAEAQALQRAQRDVISSAIRTARRLQEANDDD